MISMRIYFVDHSTCTTMWDDPRLPTIDTDAPVRVKRNYRQKVVCFRSQPSKRLITDTKCDVRVRCGWVFKEGLAAICNDVSLAGGPPLLRKRLTVKSEGEDALDSMLGMRDIQSDVPATLSVGPETPHATTVADVGAQNDHSYCVHDDDPELADLPPARLRARPSSATSGPAARVDLPRHVLDLHR
jgi:hypothetical protein